MIVLSERRAEEIQTLARKILMDVWARTTLRYVTQVNVEEIEGWGSSGKLLLNESKELPVRWRR